MHARRKVCSSIDHGDLFACVHKNTIFTETGPDQPNTALMQTLLVFGADPKQ